MKRDKIIVMAKVNILLQELAYAEPDKLSENARKLFDNFLKVSDENIILRRKVKNAISYIEASLKQEELKSRKDNIDIRKDVLDILR